MDTARTLSQVTPAVHRPSHISGMSRIAGILYILIAVASGVAHGYVPSTLLVAGDSAATLANLSANPGLFRLGFGSELLILLSEVALSVLLYFLLRPVGKSIAMMASAFRLVMTTIHGLNLLNYFFALEIVKMTIFPPDQQQALLELFLTGHARGFSIGIVFLIPHMFLLGYLMLKALYIPKPIGALFVVAGVGYLIDSVLRFSTETYTATPAILAIMIASAEIIFPLWLLIRGINSQAFAAQENAI